MRGTPRQKREDQKNQSTNLEDDWISDKNDKDGPEW